MRVHESLSERCAGTPCPIGRMSGPEPRMQAKAMPSNAARRDKRHACSALSHLQCAFSAVLKNLQAQARENPFCLWVAHAFVLPQGGLHNEYRSSQIQLRFRFE